MPSEPNYSQLVARLRTRADIAFPALAELLIEAADAIDALVKERDKQITVSEGISNALIGVQTVNDTLTAELQRLRETLTFIVEMPRPVSDSHGIKLYNEGIDTCAEIARAALTLKETS